MKVNRAKTLVEMTGNKTVNNSKRVVFIHCKLNSNEKDGKRFMISGADMLAIKLVITCNNGKEQ